MSDANTEAERIAAALTDIMAPSLKGDAAGTAVLTAFVLVTEWLDERGEPLLIRSDGPAATQNKWKRDGMLHEALYGDWDPSGDDGTDG